MSIYLANEDAFLGRPSIWRADPDCDRDDVTGAHPPRKLLLSLTSRCNLQCAHCWRGKGFAEPGHDMSEELLEYIISDVLPGMRCVQVGGSDVGEQMLAPHLPRFLKAAQAAAIPVDLITNGTRISRDNAPLLMSSLSRILLSVEGMGGNYERIRSRHWSRFLDRLQLLTTERDQHRNSCAIVLHVTVITPFAEDYPKLLELASQRGVDQVVFRDYIPHFFEDRHWSPLYTPISRAHLHDKLRRRADSLGLSVILPQPLTGQRGQGRAPCSFPFEVIGIQADGRLAPCCNQSFGLGSIAPQGPTVAEQWRAQAYRDLRRRVNGPEAPQPCRRCEIVHRDASGFRPWLSMLALNHVYIRSGLRQRPRLASLARRFKELVYG